MTPADRKNPGEQPGATLADIERIEAIGVQSGRVVVARLLLVDGRRASWCYVLGLPPGQRQELHIVVDDDGR